MRPNGVEVPPPALDEDLGLQQRIELLSREQLVAELGVEALAVAVRPGAAGLDERGPGSHRGDPLSHGLGDELGTIVRTDMAGNATQDEEVRQDVPVCVRQLLT